MNETEFYGEENDRIEEIRIKESAELFMEQHKKESEHWNEGNINKFWEDSLGYICVKYESGNLFHYKMIGEDQLYWY